MIVHKLKSIKRSLSQKDIVAFTNGRKRTFRYQWQACKPEKNSDLNEDEYRQMYKDCNYSWINVNCPECLKMQEDF